MFYTNRSIAHNLILVLADSPQFTGKSNKEEHVLQISNKTGHVLQIDL